VNKRSLPISILRQQLSLASAGRLRYNFTSKNNYWEQNMAGLATTKMSSKGQVVIPEDIRKQLNLKPGVQFVVVGAKDVVILKTISAPSMDDFDALIAEARIKGKEAGLKKSDIAAAVARARGRK